VADHEVAVVVEGQGVVSGWIEYSIENNMLNPADSFTLKRPWSADAWNVLRTDSRVRVQIDGTPVLDGFIDRRRKSTRDDTIEVTGRDRAGRLYQESAPSIDYSGLTMVDAIKRLVDPWFTKVTLSDARNRAIRLGKGRRMPSGTEPVVLNTKVKGSAGKVHPGQTRWQVIQEIVSQAGLIAWSSADGKEFFVGYPNPNAAAQFLVLHAARDTGSTSTCKSLEIVDDIGDRYSMIAVVGTSAGDARNYGQGVERSSVTYDGDGIDGVGGDFRHPKRLLMPERNFDSQNDAAQVARQEMARRNVRRHVVTATMKGHGQRIGGASTPTIFAPNTIARVIDEEQRPIWDDTYIVLSCTFTGSSSGQETQVEAIPDWQGIVL
jgi:prophage tail gpP-like protein